MKIIDTHTHMNAEQLYQDRKEVYQRALDNGVVKVINNADTLESIKNIDSLALEFPNFCYSAVGIFPTEGSDDLDKDLASLESAISSTHNLVAIGEIGLDYHEGKSSEIKEKQKKLFLAQIKIAEKHGLPIIVHSRDAGADTFNTIIDSKFAGNVTLHCYSGAFQMALRYLRHKDNVYFGIGGVLTFKNAVKEIETVQRVPYDHFLLETDAPYLAPVPYRGQRNEPSYIVKTLQVMSKLLNKDETEVADEIYHKSLGVYGLHE